MKEILEKKTKELVESVTSDPRWDLESELMVQVLGFSLCGYAFGTGRVNLFMDVEDIMDIATQRLVDLGVGPAYARGLIEDAHNRFLGGDEESLHYQLVGVGHSHTAPEDLPELVESIFKNTEAISGMSA